MKISINSNIPIFIQVAEGIEEDILRGELSEEEQVISTNQFAALYGINPATAAKGINMLVEEDVLYKKRGIGMFVKTGAKEYIVKKRKKSFFDEYLLKAIKEGEKLQISKEDMIDMIKNYS